MEGMVYRSLGRDAGDRMGWGRRKRWRAEKGLRMECTVMGKGWSVARAVRSKERIGWKEGERRGRGRREGVNSRGGVGDGGQVMETRLR